MDFLSLFENAKKMITGGKSVVTPSFDVTKTQTSTPMLGKGESSIAGVTSTGIKDLIKGQGTFAPQTNLGIARNTILGIPSVIADAFTPRKEPVPVRRAFETTPILTKMPPAVTGLADFGYRLLEAIPKAGATVYGELFAPEKKTGSVNLGIDARRLGYTEPKYQTATKEVTDRINAGENPFIVALNVGSNKTLDVAFGASLLTGMLKSVSARLLKGGVEAQTGAWEMLGKPKTLQEAEINYRNLAKQLHPDNPLGSQEAFTTVNNAMNTLRTSGIPSIVTKAQVTAGRTAEVLSRETPLGNGKFNTPDISMRKSPIAPAPISGYLPGYVSEQQGIKAGLSTEPIKPVGFTKTEVADNISRELANYKVPVLKIDNKNTTFFSEEIMRLEELQKINSERALTNKELDETYNLLKGEGIDVLKEPTQRQKANANRKAAILDRTTMKPSTVDGEIMTNINNIISKGKEAVIQPRDTIGRFDYKTKTPTASITAPTIKTDARIISESIPQKKGLVERAKDYWKNLPNKEGGFARVPDFEGMSQSEQNRILREIRGEVLKNDPARELNKHFGKSFDTISQQLENFKGTSRATFIQDKVSELGYKNIDEAQVALDKYKNVSKEYKSTRYSREGIPLATPSSMKAKLEKQTTPVQERMATPRPSPIQEVSGGTGEVRSLERMAEQQLQSSNLPSDVKSRVSLTKIIEKLPTPVKAKINMIDYIRTPENVLKKIGLEKEAKLIREGYDAYLKELPKNIDKITEWSKRVPKESNERIFKYLDGETVDLTPTELRVVGEIKTWLKEWADRLGLPEDNRIADYITHIFDKELIAKEFDEDLAKIIADKIPGSVYNPFLQARLGKLGYRQDTWAALDAYVKRATRKVNMDPALEKVQDAAGHLEESQWDYVKSLVDRINMRPTKWDNIVDNGIKQVIGYRLGQRPLASITKTLRQWTYRGMLGLNPGSALRNLSQGINTYAKLGEKYTVIGYSKLFSKANQAELTASGVLNASFMQDRAMSAMKKTMEKADKGLFYMFEQAERINRGAAYFGAKAKGISQGMTEEQAIEYAKKIVRETQFQFGTIDTPVGMSSDIIKTLTQFQTFTTKQIEFLSNMAKNKEWAGLIRYVLSGIAFVYTIGQAFGMKPTDLIPTYRLSDERVLGIPVPVSLKFPAEVINAVTDQPNKYGQQRSTGQKIKDVLNTLPGYVPAGGQIKKSVQGYKAIKEGGSYDASGRLQFAVGQTPYAKAQALLFGKYSSKEAKDYFNRGEISKEEKSKIQPIFDEVQRLKSEGNIEDAQSIVDSLSDTDYATYKKIKSSDTALKTVQGKQEILPIYNQVQKLKESGNTTEAQSIVDNLTDEQYKNYKLVKSDQDKIKKAKSGDKPTFDPNTTTSDNTVIDTVWAYAKALGTDPVTAFKRIFTGQKIRYVTNGTIVVERMPLAESQAEKKTQGSTGAEVKLDHTIPLQLGGDNSKENLKLVPTAIWDSYTPVENILGKALRSGKITKKEAQQIIQDFKDNKITSEEINVIISNK